MRCLSIAALAMLTGCQSGIYFTDDEGGPISNGRLIDYHADNVSLPYALGTTVELTVRQTPRDISGWMLVSDTPDIFAVDGQMIDSSNTLSAKGHALAEGGARLRLLDASGGERHAMAIDVRAADSARFFAHGDLRVLGSQAVTQYAQAEIADARVLAGGKSVIAVGYFHAAQRVYGRGIATITSVPQSGFENKTSSGAPINDWLFVEPAQPGSYQLTLQQNGITLGTLPITAVADSEVTGLSIAAESTASKSDNDETWLLARAHGSDGHEVLGVYCDWTLDGAAQPDQNQMQRSGDLYRYRFAKGAATRTVAASHNGVSADIAVQVHDGYVTDTTYLGCSAAPGRTRAPSLGWLLVLLALASARLLRRAAIAP